MADIVIRVGPKTDPKFTTYYVEMIGGMILEISQVEHARRFATREEATTVAEKDCPSGWELEETEVPYVPKPEPKKKARRARR